MPGRAVHACNSSAGEAKTGGSWIPGQLGLHSETLFQKQALNDSNNNKQQLKADGLEGQTGISRKVELCDLGLLNSSRLPSKFFFPSPH